MARFVVDIPDDLNKEFRIKIIETYGTEKGSLTKAIKEAIRLWLKEKEVPSKKG